MPLAHELVTHPLILPTGVTTGVYAQRAMRQWFYGRRVPKQLGLEPGLLRQVVLNLMSSAWPRTCCSCVRCCTTHYLTATGLQKLMLTGRCPLCP